MTKQHAWMRATGLALACAAVLGGCSKPTTEPQSTAAADQAAADRAALLDAREKQLAEREEALRAERDAAAAPPPVVEAPPAPKPRVVENRPKPRPAAPPKSATAMGEHPPITPPKPMPVKLTVPAGTRMTVALNSDLSSRTAKQGDSFDARVTSDILVDGRVAVPSGSRVTGTVTDVISGSNSIGGVPTLGLRFDSLILPSGDKVAINGELMEQGKSDTGRDTAKILGGAAAGAILGHQVKSNDGGKVIGGLLGGAIGALAAKKTGTEVTLPAGETITISIGAPLELKAT